MVLIYDVKMILCEISGFINKIKLLFIRTDRSTPFFLINKSKKILLKTINPKLQNSTIERLNKLNLPLKY